MPKDPTKNVDRYKIGGSHLNEYDFENAKTAVKQQRTADKKQSTAGKQSQKSASKSPKKK